MQTRIAYLPLDTYPEAAPDPAILTAIGVATGLGCSLHVSTFSVDIPPVAFPLGGVLLDVEGMARMAEERSQAECKRLRALVEAEARADQAISVIPHRVRLGGASAAAAVEARYLDLCVVPWSAEAGPLQDMAQALVFGSGLPVILVPAGAKPRRADHVAIAWDESRVAARALHDALALLEPGGRVTVLTVHDEKPLHAEEMAQTLAASLRLRGYEAAPVDLALGGKPIGEALQAAALAAGAGLLAMGAFGHSRLRDFILGGATKGVAADLRMPVLMAH